MSEIADVSAPADTGTSSPDTSSAPQSTTDIARETIQSLESADTQASAPATIEKQPAIQEKPVELSEAAKFLLAQGHKAKKDDGRDNWFPYKTIEGVLERYLTHHRSTWDGARTEIERVRDQYKADLDELYADTRDPKALLTKLAQFDERYKAYLQPHTVEPPAAPVLQLPDGDIPLPDGTRTYSIDAVKTQLVPWIVQQAKAEAKAEAEAAMKPYAEREKAEKERAADQKAEASRRERTQKQMTEAQTWPGFGTLAPDQPLTEFQMAVLKRLQGDREKAEAAGTFPTMTLKEAYLEERSERLAGDETKVRERVIKELDGAAKSKTGVTGGGAEHTRQRGARSTQDIARETIAALERGA